MMKEKLQEYALIAEIVGGVAIVASLIFVGMQINLNTQTAQVNAFNELTSQILDVNLLLAESPDLAVARIKDSTDQELSNIESATLIQIYIYIIRHGDIAFLQYKEGFVDQKQLNSLLAPLINQINTPRFAQTWEAMKVNIDSSFVEYVERMRVEPI